MRAVKAYTALLEDDFELDADVIHFGTGYNNVKENRQDNCLRGILGGFSAIFSGCIIISKLIFSTACSMEASNRFEHVNWLHSMNKTPCIQVLEQLRNWSFDKEGETGGTWRQSAGPGIWVIGDNLAFCRFHSRLSRSEQSSAPYGAWLRPSFGMSLCSA